MGDNIERSNTACYYSEDSGLTSVIPNVAFPKRSQSYIDHHRDNGYIGYAQVYWQALLYIVVRLRSDNLVISANVLAMWEDTCPAIASQYVFFTDVADMILFKFLLVDAPPEVISDDAEPKFVTWW